MNSSNLNLKRKLDMIDKELGSSNTLVIKKILIGNPMPLEAALIYVNGLADKNMIENGILKPLMLYINEELIYGDGIEEYLCARYIAACSTSIETEMNKAMDSLKRGSTLLLVGEASKLILINTSKSEYRSINEPVNEQVIRGAREGFIENIETNITILRRRIRNKNLTVEKLTVGRYTQNDVALVYIKDIADEDVVDEIRKRISTIDVDEIGGAGAVEQYIEAYPYSIFPQSFTTERPDIVQANIAEGRVAILVENTSTVITAPTVLEEFFQAVEDYNQRSIVSSLTRMLRIVSSFIIITLPSIYLTLIKFNSELLPIKFIVPVIQSRQNIVLPPFLEILSMEIVVEFLREGGIRLPSKIGQILSVAGGIIIGDAATKSHFASPTTLLVVGITVVATFVIPNYDMAVSIRLLRFPLLLLAEMAGMFGIAFGWFLLIVHLYSLESFGVPYINTGHFSDLKDIIIRAQFWKMNTRPKSIPNKNPIRQTDFRSKWINGKGNKK